MGRLVAGIDSSTQSTKAVVIDAETGVEVATGRAVHEVTGYAGARESDPNMWWSALTHALAETGCAADIRAISVAAQQHGLVVVDDDGRALRRAILWNDTRSAEDSEQLIDSLGGRERWAAVACSVPVSAFTVSSWAWLRRSEPEVASQVRGIRLPHDYLTERLTGIAVTDRGDASGTGWWSPASGRYEAEVLELDEVQLDEAMLPRVLAPDEQAGVVASAAAKETGLTEGTPVGPGTGDNMAAALGMGLRVGDVGMSLGTSGTVFGISEKPSADATGVIAGFADADGSYLPLACTLNCTQAVDRFAELLGLDRDEVADETDVIVLPFLDGERTPDLPHSAGTILGLRHGTSREQILLAAYRGAVASLLEAVERMATSGAPVTDGSRIVLVGGGAQGATWQRVVCELSGRPVSVPTPSEFVARGAATQAAAILEGGMPGAVSRRWAEVTQGVELPARARNDAAVSRIHQATGKVASLYPGA